MDITQLLGSIGTILSVATYLPQVVKMWRTRSVTDISMATLIIQIVNVSIWLAYGVLSDKVPLIIVNVFMFTSSAMMIILKIKYGKNYHKSHA